MEFLYYFVQAQTPFGVLGLCIFFSLLAVFLRSLAKGKRPLIIQAAAVALPMLANVFAALIHLDDMRRAFERSIPDILNPIAGIQLVSELLLTGAGMSLVLGALSFWCWQKWHSRHVNHAKPTPATSSAP